MDTGTSECRHWDVGSQSHLPTELGMAMGGCAEKMGGCAEKTHLGLPPELGMAMGGGAEKKTGGAEKKPLG